MKNYKDHVTFRCSKLEKFQLEKIADYRGKSTSEVIRELIHAKAKEIDQSRSFAYQLTQKEAEHIGSLRQ